VIVAGMQANGGLVEHVAHTLQIGAQLRSEANALRLAAAEGGRTPVQGQIAQAHFLEKLESALNLGQQIAGNIGFACRQPPGSLQGLNPGAHIAHTQAGQVGDGLAMKADRACSGIQAGAAARGTGLLLDVVDVGLGKALLAPLLVVVAHRIVECPALIARELDTGTHAIGAPAVLAVVRKQAWVEFGVAGRTHRAGAQGGKHLQPPDASRWGAAVERGLQTLQVGQHMHHALAMLQRAGQQLAQLGLRFGSHIETAHRQLDGVLFESVDARKALCGQKLTIDPQMGVAARPRPIGQLGVDALAVDHQRRQQTDVLAAEGGHQLGQYAVGRLGLHRCVVVHTVLRAQLDIEQAQKVPDLGSGANGGFAASSAEALLDGDGRGNAIHRIDFGATGGLHDAAGVGVETFEVAALPFVEEDVKRQRGFARAADTCDDIETTSGNVDRQALEIVLGGVEDADHVRLQGFARGLISDSTGGAGRIRRT